MDVDILFHFSLREGKSGHGYSSTLGHPSSLTDLYAGHFEQYVKLNPDLEAIMVSPANIFFNITNYLYERKHVFLKFEFIEN